MVCSAVVTVLPYGAVDQTYTNIYSAYVGGVLALTRLPDGS